MKPLNKCYKRLLNIITAFTFIGIACAPVFFRLSDYTKNPKEFNRAVKNRYNYHIVWVKSTSFPEILALAKMGDIEQDQNGKENKRILEIDGDIFTMRIRISTLDEDSVILHPGIKPFKPGNNIEFINKEYILRGISIGSKKEET